jgi:hypothetical protein
VYRRRKATEIGLENITLLPQDVRAMTRTTGITFVSRVIYLLYFVTHIPVTICVDLQALFPGLFEGTVLRDLFTW